MTMGLIVLAPICGAVSKDLLLNEPVPPVAGTISFREHAYHMILLKILWSFLWNRVILMALRALPLSSSHSLLTSCSTNCDIVILRWSLSNLSTRAVEVSKYSLQALFVPLKAADDLASKVLLRSNDLKNRVNKPLNRWNKPSKSIFNLTVE